MSDMMSPPALPRWLALAAALAVAGCASTAAPLDLSPAARRSLADTMAAEGNDTAALDILREAARRAPDDADAQERYGLAAERARLYPEALAALSRAVAVGGPAPVRLVAEGRIALQAGDVPAAAGAYARALEQAPGNVDALSGLGVAEDLQRRHAEAQAHYRAALRLLPGDWGLRSNLALSLLMSGQAGEAAGTLAGAAADPAAPRRARHDLALALVAAGRRAEAVTVLQADMPAPEAAALADEFAAFARWLASPEGSRPALR